MQREDPAKIFKPRPKVLDDRGISTEFFYSPPGKPANSRYLVKSDDFSVHSRETTQLSGTYPPSFQQKEEFDDLFEEKSPNYGVNGVVTSLAEFTLEHKQIRGLEEDDSFLMSPTRKPSRPASRAFQFTPTPSGSVRKVPVVEETPLGARIGDPLLRSTSSLIPIDAKTPSSDLREIRCDLKRIEAEFKDIKAYFKTALKTELNRIEHAAIVFQKHWRGYKTRKSLGVDAKKIVREQPSYDELARKVAQLEQELKRERQMREAFELKVKQILNV